MQSSVITIKNTWKENYMRAQTLTPENLRKQFVSRAIRNIKRGYADDESGRGMFRSEIRLDLSSA